MTRVQIVCLANSYKLRGRCVAGLRLDGGGWVRPVAATTHGQLNPEHYVLSDRTEPAVLDILELALEHPEPLPHQPENWRIADQPWKRLYAGLTKSVSALLRSNLTRGPLLFGDVSHRVAAGPAPSSLALVEPEGLQWFMERKPGGPKRPRAQFALSNAFYDLPVTDPAWVDVFRDLAPGLHPMRACGLPSSQKLLLTISLGDEFEFDGYCYKLVAGLVPIPKT